MGDRFRKPFGGLISRSQLLDVRVQGAYFKAAARHGGAIPGLTVDRFSVATARNKVVAEALTYGQGVDSVWFCDADVLVPDDALELMAQVDAPVVSALVPIFHRRPGQPSHFYWNVAEQMNGRERVRWHTEQFDDVRQVDGCGAGCVLIDLDVFRLVEFPWFELTERLDNPTSQGGRYVVRGEDMNFCERLQKLDLKIMAHGGVVCGHLNEVNLLDVLQTRIAQETMQ